MCYYWCMDKREVACPYCGFQIHNDDERCPRCKEFFVEPNLSEFKLVSIPLYLVSEIVLSVLGLPLLYTVIWYTINYKNICNIAIPLYLKKFKILFIGFLLFICIIYAISILMPTIFIPMVGLIGFILEIFLTYRVIRIIEEYTLKKYDSPITHHDVGLVFFRTLYLICFLDTYLIRVKDPNRRYCLDTDKWFIYSAILLVLGVMLFGLSLVGANILKF